MKKFLALIVSTAVLFVGVLIFSFLIEGRLKSYVDKKEQIAEELGFQERVLSLSSYIPLFGDSDEDKVEAWQTYEKEAKSRYNAALLYTVILFVFVLCYGLFNSAFYRGKVGQYQIYGLTAVFAAMSFWYLGLTAPMIELMAYEKDLSFSTGFMGDVTYDGRIYFFYQNKSVVTLISALFTGGNFLLAFAVGLFSVVFPAVKFVVSLLVLFKPKKAISLKRYKIVRNLGKWSMADVFVASVFLAVFAYSNLKVGVDTGSETLVGAYFYLTFTIVSIASGVFLKKAMKEVQEISDWEMY